MTPVLVEVARNINIAVDEMHNLQYDNNRGVEIVVRA